MAGVLATQLGCVDAQDSTPTDAAPAADAAPDAAVTTDATIEVDQATPEPDMALEPDMAPEPDMAVEPDMAPELDMAVEPDMAPEPDMAVEPDMEPEPDMALEPDADPGPPPCDPPLQIDPAVAFARPYDLLTFRARGGTGAWRFELSVDASGALLNEITGAFLAGEITDVVDTVRVTDLGCVGEATATVNLVEPIEVHPARAELGVEAGFTFDVQGGSGRYAFALTSNRSGAVIDAEGHYQAGPEPGIDRVRITDAETDETVFVELSVVRAPRLHANPPYVVIPVGAAHPIEVVGGSDTFDARLLGFGASYQDGQLTGFAPGDLTLELTDRFTGLETAVAVHVVESLQPEFRTVGQLKTAMVIHGPGDLNGDGFADALLAQPDLDVGGADAGGVVVYAGGPEGLEPEPVQVLPGFSRREESGRDLAVADFDGDGELDLAVGAFLADVGAGDTGAVYVYRGRPGGFFHDEPTTLGGPRGSDHMGMSLAACDFNGDGRMDLAVGGRLHENRAEQGTSNQGAVLVWLGYPDGFLREPDQVVYGQAPDADGVLRDAPNMRLGSWGMAAGDFDGDGLCDVAAQGDEFRLPIEGRPNADAAVLIFRGAAPDELGPGGLEPWASKVIVPDENTRNSRIGRRMDTGDIDGDGLDDLVVSHYLHDTNGGDNNQGAVRIFRGGPFDGPATGFTHAAEADWTVFGPNSGDQFGWSVQVAEVDGAAPLDIVATGFYTEHPEGPNTTGSAFVFAGRMGEMPSPDPIRAVHGHTAYDLFGEAAAALGDVDGDGIVDLLIGAGRHDPEGNTDFGAVWYDNGVDPLRPLEIPGEPSAMQFGHGVALLGDVNGDGFGDVMAGSPFHSFGTAGRAGTAWLFSGEAGRYGTEASLVLEGFPQHSSYDLAGYRVSSAGDFDGDGFADFAVAVRADERPGNLPAPFVPDGDGCPVRAGDQGAVYIFRGGPDLDDQPDWVYWGPRSGANLHALSPTDFNGDGRSDLVFGSHFWDMPGANDAGGAVLLAGRPAPEPGTISVICDQPFTINGGRTSDHLGRTVAGLGDLNGDGCDESAVGVPLDDEGRGNAGAIWVVFGWGGRGCPAEPRGYKLISNNSNDQIGTALAGGSDLNGDGVPDLVTGAIGARNNNQTTGGALVVSGAWLGSLPTAPFDAPGDSVVITSGNPVAITGEVAGERFGASVASAGPYFAVGTPMGSYSGVAQVGGARVYRVVDGEAELVAHLVGETWRPGGRVGEALAGGWLTPDLPAFVVGGLDANGAGFDAGAVYAFPVPLPE